jgi:hypothetical protein
MRSRGWFLPKQPDVLGLLRRQLAVTIEGVEAFAAWANGNEDAATTVREIEHRGDAAKWELLEALREAFVTPLEPEDVFALSRGIDWILDYARDLINESEALDSPPDAELAEMAGLLVEAMRHLDEALAALDSSGETATEAARAAIKTERRMEHAYYRAMAVSLAVEDRSERIARREIYRRCTRIGEVVIDVAERVVYAVVKQS